MPTVVFFHVVGAVSALALLNLTFFSSPSFHDLLLRFRHASLLVLVCLEPSAACTYLKHALGFSPQTDFRVEGCNALDARDFWKHMFSN